MQEKEKRIKKITVQDQIKAWKKANRELELERGLPRGGAHKTSKKDKRDKSSNTVKEWENEE